MRYVDLYLKAVSNLQEAPNRYSLSYIVNMALDIAAITSHEHVTGIHISGCRMKSVLRILSNVCDGAFLRK